jgi:large subunit ribosomal protein L54
LSNTYTAAKSKSKRQAAKKARKAGGEADITMRKVPLYEQSIDMPAGDGTVEGAILAEAARDELTKAMRQKRRATIKETNFLKTMS